MRLATTGTPAALALAMIIAVPATAQTRSVRDTATAYGARLTAKGAPAALNQYRVNNRVNNRIESRLSLRIERYRPDATANPTAAFQATQDDKSRSTPVLAPQVPGDDPD